MKPWTETLILIAIVTGVLVVIEKVQVNIGKPDTHYTFTPDGSPDMTCVAVQGIGLSCFYKYDPKEDLDATE